MPNRITFEHKVLTSGQHAITSPDIKGFCVVGAPDDTLSNVERQAIEAVSLLRNRSAGAVRERVVAIEYEAA